MIFRVIEPADVQALFAVRSRTRENRYGIEELNRLEITAATVTEKLQQTYKGWLCQVEDTVAGFSMVDCLTGELWVIAVLPEFEGMGIGGRLMALAEEWLWSCGHQRAWLTTDVNPQLRAYGFYRHRGWHDWKIENGLRYMQLSAPGSDALSSIE